LAGNFGTAVDAASGSFAVRPELPLECSIKNARTPRPYATATRSPQASPNASGPIVDARAREVEISCFERRPPLAMPAA
jgi:hypothetical protein